MGRLCYPTKAPGTVPYFFSRETSHGARRVWRTFCRPGTKFIEHYECRGTSLIGAANLSPVTNLVAGTGAVSRYKLSRSQKSVIVQDLNCLQMRALTAVATAKAGVRVQETLRICLECRSKSKKCDKQLTHIVRVRCWQNSHLNISSIFSYAKSLNFSKIQ